MNSNIVQGITWKRIDETLIFNGTGPIPDTETTWEKWPDPFGSDDDYIWIPNTVSPWSYGGNCQWVKTIIINEGITAVGKRAFTAFDCEKVILPHSLRAIKSEAFAECKRLKYVTIPEGLVTIEESAFYNCIFLKTIELPDTATDISPHMYWKSWLYGEKKDLIIRAHKGTCAETYAREAGYHFEPI